MFKWFKKIIQETRILYDYPSYEAECRKKHMVAANSRYSTAVLRQKIRALMEPILKEDHAKYAEITKNLHSCIQDVEFKIKDCSIKLSLLERYYKDELDHLYAELSRLNANKKELYKEKDEAYNQFNCAKDSINDWHSKSDRSAWLGGNKGKNIPNHAMFGQSKGDLDSYKSSRDSAYSHLQSCKYDINNVKNIINSLKSKIQIIKDDRRKMYDLKKEGFNITDLKVSLNKYHKIHKEKSESLDNIKVESSTFMQDSKHNAGIDKLENMVVFINKSKQAFIREFDSDISCMARKEEHRISWINKYA